MQMKMKDEWKWMINDNKYVRNQKIAYRFRILCLFFDE